MLRIAQLHCRCLDSSKSASDGGQWVEEMKKNEKLRNAKSWTSKNIFMIRQESIPVDQSSVAIHVQGLAPGIDTIHL